MSGLLFIHIPKTGGTSIRTWLKANGGLDEYHEDGTAIIRGGKHITICHQTMAEAKAQVQPATWHGDKEPFCVVRNPWDRALSYWWFIQNISRQDDPIWVCDDYEDWCGLLAERHTGSQEWAKGLNARQRLAPQVEWADGCKPWRAMPFAIANAWTSKVTHSNHREKPKGFKDHQTPVTVDLISRAWKRDVEELGYEP